MRYDKLMIIAHIWYLRLRGKPLLSDEIVVTKISINVERYLNERRFREISLFKMKFTDDEKKIIDDVIRACSDYTPEQLAVLVRKMCQREKCLENNVRVVPESYMTEVKDRWY